MDSFLAFQASFKQHVSLTIASPVRSQRLRRLKIVINTCHISFLLWFLMSKQSINSPFVNLLLVRVRSERFKVTLSNWMCAARFSACFLLFARLALTCPTNNRLVVSGCQQRCEWHAISGSPGEKLSFRSGSMPNKPSDKLTDRLWIFFQTSQGTCWVSL